MSLGSSEGRRPATESGSPRPTLVRLLFAGAVILIGGFFLVKLTADHTRTTVEPGPKKPPVGQGPEIDQPEEPQEPKTPTTAPDSLAVRNSELIAVERRLERLREDIGEIGSIGRRVEAMYTNDDGRKLASNPESAQQFLAVAGLVTLEDIDKWNTELEESEATVKRSRAVGPEERLPDQQSLRELEETISVALVRFREVDQLLDTLIGELPEPSSGCPTLMTAIERRNKERNAILNRRLGEARQQTQEKVNAELEDFTGQIGVLQGEIESLRKRAEADAEAHRLEQERIDDEHREELRKQEDAYADLERRFAVLLPQYEAYLKPFTSDGYSQPNGRRYKQTTTKGPVSYSKLLGSGMLEETEGSLSTLYLSIDGKSNERELGAFPPPDSWSLNKHRDTVLAVQSFLRTFGPVMVEEGLLAP